jgi:hypothetical protein
MSAAINLSRSSSDSIARAFITTYRSFVYIFFCLDFCCFLRVFTMNSDEKYKTCGGSSRAVNGCTKNRRKLNLWKESMCEKHGQLYASCTCLVPYKLHTMPSAEPANLEWIRIFTNKCTCQFPNIQL